MAHSWETRWKLQERLGKGGQGITHAATFVEDSTIRGALKYLKNNNDIQARGRMYREVANLKTLADAGGAVPRVLDHNTQNYEDLKLELFVVMDLIQGCTLSDLVAKEKRLDVDDALKFVIALCKTIKLAHSIPILHRDIKPENIMVRDAGSADLVIVDFGLSFNSHDTGLTETDETFRNRFLDLPETNTPSGDRRDPRSDISAICAILYYCLTGHVPGQLVDGTGALPHMRAGYSLHESIDANDKRIRLLEDFLSRGFAPNLSNRYQTVEEAVERLSELDSERGFDLSDPFQLAAHLSMELQKRDRITQIREFSKHAKTLFDFVDREIGKYRGTLGQFILDQGGGFMGGGFPGGTFGGGRKESSLGLPDGLDLVEERQQPLLLQVSHHQKLNRERRLVIASSGTRCVLLAVDFRNLGNAAKKCSPEDWIEIGWYEGSPEPIFSLVAISIRDWLKVSMSELASEVLT